MKYTVLIRQPVPDAVRPELEGQLVSRFQLTPEQAARLAARRAGRLMKPTSQARAALLLEVFSGVGAQVSLEEVREEGSSLLGSPLAPISPPSSDGLGATPLGAAEREGGGSAAVPIQDRLSGVDPAVQDDPFAAPAAEPLPTTLVTAAPIPPPAADPGVGDPGLPDWARAPGPRTERPLGRVAASSPGTAVAVKEPPVHGHSEAAGSAPAATSGGSDDWADFAGALSLPESAPAPRPARDAPRQPTEFLTEVSEGVAVTTRPRSTVTQQIQLGALLPLVVSSTLMMGVLALSLPRIQTRLVQDNARSLASVVASNLNASSAAQLKVQLENVTRAPGVSFARVSLPGGEAYLRADGDLDGAALKKVLDPWIANGKSAGTLNVGGERYVVSRVSVVRDAQNQVLAVPVGEEAGRTVLRRASVGLVGAQAASALSQTLTLLALLTLLGLGLAWWLANLAARRITGPLERLVEVADAISLGDLTRPVRMERNDEIGDLAQALERMRLSLEAAMDRLRRRKRG